MSLTPERPLEGVVAPMRRVSPEAARANARPKGPLEIIVNARLIAEELER